MGCVRATLLNCTFTLLWAPLNLGIVKPSEWLIHGSGILGGHPCLDSEMWYWDLEMPFPVLLLTCQLPGEEMVVSVSHGLDFHTRLYNPYSLGHRGAPGDSRVPSVLGDSQDGWGCLLSLGAGGTGQEVAGREASGSKEQGDLWASVCKCAVLTMLIHFG